MVDEMTPRRIVKLPASLGGGLLRRTHAVVYGTAGLPIKYFTSQADAEYWMALTDAQCHCALPRGTCQACRQKAAGTEPAENHMGE